MGGTPKPTPPARILARREAVDNGPALLPAPLEHRPDVAVIDVRPPPTVTDEGLQAAIAARTRIPGPPTLMLSQHVEPLYARRTSTSTPASSVAENSNRWPDGGSDPAAAVPQEECPGRPYDRPRQGR
ncbi:hypothetical protein GCM10010199_08720 [Dactylosporangium roseum]